MESLVLKQGLLPSATHRVEGKVLSVLYNTTEEFCVVLHSNGISRFENGKKGLTLEKEVKLLWIFYTNQFDQFIGVGRDSIELLAKDFTSFFHTSSPTPISCSLYNTYSGDVVTAGLGNITIWSFHQGGRTLLPNEVITTGLQDQQISLLHFEDVPGNAQRCFAVVGTGIKVFHLMSGRLLQDVTELHSRPISAVLFFRPLQYLITGARDGAIKVWTSSWDLYCTFIGHQSPVTGLSPYTTGPFIISGSLDSTLRVWNLIHCDQVQQLDHNVPVQGLVSEPGRSTVVSYSSRQLRLWSVNQLYQRTTIIGADCIAIHCTTHPSIPLRLVATCSDATIRLISPVGGAIITTALLPSTTTITNTAYKPHHEELYVLNGLEGSVTKFDTSTNPCTVHCIWERHEDNDIGSYTCLSLYELVLDNDDIEELLANDRWLSVAVDAQKVIRGMDDPLLREKEGLYLLLAGTDKGFLAVLNDNDGSIQCSVKGHNSGISMIECNPKSNYIITTSTDEHVLIWRVYPYTNHDCLVIMMSFNVIGVPTHMAVLPDRLCIAVNDDDKASYSLTMYSLGNITCFSSNPAHNHTEPITGLDVHLKLCLFVSCGDDCTVRVWSEDNHILRILQLDAPPTSVAFSSPFGAISLGLHHHLYTISHTTYLTESYLKQLVSLAIATQEDQSEQQRYFLRPLEEFSDDDQLRLRPQDDQFQAEAYRGALSSEELDALDKVAALKSQTIQLLLAREQELCDIRDGNITANKTPQSLTVLQRNKAWKEVFSLLHSLPPLTLPLPTNDDFDPDTYGLPVEIPVPYEPYQKGPRRSFFPPLSKFDPPYPVAPDGYLPNSVLLQKLRKSEEDRLLAEKWRPPVLSDKQRLLMEQVQALADEELEEEEDSELMARLRAAMTAPADSPISSPSPLPSPPPSPPKREVKSQMKIEKLIAPKVKPKTPPRQRTPSPPPRSPTPPPPPTPLPEYITQFIGQPWFDSLFPQPNSKTFPKPWTVTRFIYILISCLSRPLDSYTKADICGALHKLTIQHNPSNKDEICEQFIKLLLTLSAKNLAERLLVLKILKFIIYLDKLDSSLTTLLMGLYSEGDSEIQTLLLEYFEHKGVEDPYHYFPREIKSTLTSLLTVSLTDMVTKSTEWLDMWAEDYFRKQGVKISKKGTTRKSTSRTQSRRSISLPSYDPIEVINHFVRTEHEKELAKCKPATPPPPPPKPEEDLPRNVVVPLPHLDHRGHLIRLGETHCSRCHPERETSLHLVRHQLVARRPDWHSIQLALKTQNINPFLTEKERYETEQLKNLRQTMISQNRLFLIEQSIPQL